MTLQAQSPIAHHSLASQNRRASGYVELFLESQMDLKPAYQRGSVWTELDRLMLVKSWLTGLPVPAVVINDRMAAHWAGANGTAYGVIDGKQRIEAAVAWFTGQLQVPASWFVEEHIDSTIDTDDGAYVTHLTLTKVGRAIFASQAMLPVVEVRVATIQEEAALYSLVHMSGVEQSAEDLENAS